MGKIILEEQTTASTPASNKVAIYPKAGGGIYKIADDGVEGQLATTSYIDTQISGVDEHSEMLGLTIGDDHTQYILVDGTRAFTGNIQANASGTLDIGSLSLPFKDLYLTGSSLYINGDKVLYMSGNDLVLDSPSGNVVISGGVDLSNADIQHGALDGLSNDDHTQYILADGSRAFTGAIQANASGTLDIGSSAVPFKSIYLTGGSLHMDGRVILSTVDNNLVIDGEVLGDSTLATDHSYYTSGSNIDTVTIDDVNSVFGSVLYIETSFNYNQANAADATSSLPCRGIALEDGSGSKLILRRGKIRDDSWSWSGGDVYVSATTSGVLTQTKPSGGDWVQIVGTALSATVVYFDVMSDPLATL